ncbi:hypothetical protein V1J52_18875 [Streptomyces sp. TRM 70351]|uniref:hypothetical protein n=1 Tax=Streptomyces sp. TRM 70351 TaxID=3116552 RepID=UPI002E7AB469|nr:hypothetical protein [Streptomyces sp. TRM 70351]MEE1930222.1 hypothetical protein [Streptomyces sp. TRM 70351]
MTTGRNGRPGDGHDPADGREHGAGHGRPGGPEGHDGQDPADAEALHQLMRDVVSGIQPSPDALDHLRRAVPARRARRRHTAIGAAAAVLVTAVTVPALMSTGVVPGPLGDDGRTNAAHSGRNDGGEPYGGREAAGPAGGAADEGPDGGTGGEGTTSPAEPTRGSSSSPDGTDAAGAASPRCARDQLGEPVVRVGEPQEDGSVHGSFRLANVSGDSCRVPGGDQLTATARGAADPAAVTVLEHTGDGRVTGLPGPGTSDELVLRPGDSYQVRFAWLPDTARGANGCPAPPEEPASGSPGPGPEPEPEPSTGDGTTGGTGGTEAPGDVEGGEEAPGDGATPSEAGGMKPLSDSGSGTGGSRDDDGRGAATAVVLRYVPATGEPAVPPAYLDDVCAGTVYRTGALPAD